MQNEKSARIQSHFEPRRHTVPCMKLHDAFAKNAEFGVNNAQDAAKRIMKRQRLQTAKILHMQFASLQNETAKSKLLCILHKYEYSVL